MTSQIRKRIRGFGFLVAAILATSLAGAAQNYFSFTIRNNTSIDFIEVGLSASGSFWWEPVHDPGHIWPADPGLPAGSTRTYPLPAPGFFDLKLVDENYRVCLIPDVFIDVNTTLELNEIALWRCEDYAY
jgi:hypothetical protein